MPVPEQTPINSSTGNGVTTVFAYTFKILADADLLVTVDGVTKTLTTDYTVSGAGVDGGGNVTFVTAPASGTLVVRERALDYEREIDYQESGAFEAATVDEDLDRTVMMLQQLALAVSRALKAPASVTANQVLTDAMWAARASTFLGYDEDGELGVFGAADFGVTTASAFAQTLLDDADAPALVVTINSGLTEDTAPDKIADFLPSYDASGATGKKLRLVTAVARAMPWGQGLLINGKIVPSVAANALTLAVKGDDGNDPSATNPVYALFRKSTLTDAGFDIVPITAALSVAVSSGSTLGHASAIAQHVFVYLINSAGAAEVAVSNLPPDYPGVFGKARLVSTTAEGGAGAADSATGVYSTTARSNVSWICVAKILTTQTTAGTWAAPITQIDQAPFVVPDNRVSVTNAGTQTIATATYAKVTLSSETYDPDSVFDAATNYRLQPNVAGVYRVSVIGNWNTGLDGNGQCIWMIYRNGGAVKTVYANEYTGGQPGMCVTGDILMNGTSDYIEFYVYQAGGGNEDLAGPSRCLDAHRVTLGE